MQVSGGAVGFLDFIDPIAPKTGGAAVGFLDLIDEGEAGQIEREREEEDTWIKESLASLTKNIQLLENLATCMQHVRDGWIYYAASLLTIFRATDEQETLVRFLVESEVRNTRKETALFREDSFRIVGVQQFLLKQMNEWLKQSIYRQVLRKVIAAPSRAGKESSLATDVVRSMNENFASIPSDVHATLNKVATAVSGRFSYLSPGHNAAINFLFLHVITPCVVDPFGAGLTQAAVTDRDALLILARLGKALQKWVNNVTSDMDSSDTGTSATDDDSERSHREMERSPGEQEVIRFIGQVFKTDGVTVALKKPDVHELNEAKQVVSASLKKHYKMLRELEGALDRQQVITRYLGATQGRMFAACSAVSASTVALSSRYFSAPEALSQDAAAAERVVADTFSDFVRHGVQCLMNGERYIFIQASALGTQLYATRAVSECPIPNLIPHIVYITSFGQGVATVRRFMKDRKMLRDSWKQALLSVFPYLALTGRAKCSIGINSSLSKGNDFILTVKTENSVEVASASERKALLDCRCQGLCGFVAGWCAEASSLDLAGAELQCVSKGDKTCLFLVSLASMLDANLKKSSTELKSVVSPRTQYLVDRINTFFPANGTGSVDGTPDKRSRLSKPDHSTQASSVSDLLDALRIGLGRDISSKKDKKMTLSERMRSGSIKKKLTSQTSNSSLVASNDQISIPNPVSTPESGEMVLADQRCVMFNARDFAQTFSNAMQGLAKDGSSKKDMANNRQSRKIKLAVEQIAHVQHAGTIVLYTFGVAHGESIAKQFVGAQLVKSLPWALETLSRALSVLGWGSMSASPLSCTSDANDVSDLWAVCRVSECFESAGRLGSVFDTGPTCLCTAGTIAGFCSHLFGSRCVCVEVECVGSGTGSRGSGQCVFVVSIPSAIVSRVKMCMAMSGSEAAYPELFGGLGVELLMGEDAVQPASAEPSPLKK